MKIHELGKKMIFEAKELFEDLLSSKITAMLVNNWIGGGETNTKL